MFNIEEIENMFEIGYKVKIITGDSMSKNVFQPMITLKIGSFYEEFCVLDDFFKIFKGLIRGLQVGNIEEIVLFPFGKERLKRFNIIKEAEGYYGKKFYYLKNYPVVYDNENKIVNIYIVERLEKQMQSLVNKIYKNIVPVFAGDFSIKIRHKDIYEEVFLFLYYDSIGIDKEFAMGVPHYNFTDFEIDFFDILKEIIDLYRFKNLPDNLRNFIKFIESKIKE